MISITTQKSFMVHRTITQTLISAYNMDTFLFAFIPMCIVGKTLTPNQSSMAEHMVEDVQDIQSTSVRPYIFSALSSVMHYICYSI